MVEQKISPYECHVLVCTNDREGRRKSCADGQTPELRRTLKKQANERGWKGRVRVSQCGCLGLCDDGPNVIIYPQKVWLAGVEPGDAPQILDKVEEILQA